MSARGAAPGASAPVPSARPQAAAATIGELVAAAGHRLERAGCATPRLDAELLLAEALVVDRAVLFARPEAPVPVTAAERFAALIAGRERREPVAYLVGRRAFRRLELAVDRGVLIPRPETELLVEVALALAPPGARVHDVGTGSGAIALALADERPDLRVSASDRSPAAVAVARRNAARLGLVVAIAEADGLPAGRFDLVVANLPYVRADEWPGLAPEITGFEPRDALVAGADGLDAIRALVAEAPAGVMLALEHAPDQAAAARALLGAGAETHEGIVTTGRAR